MDRDDQYAASGETADGRRTGWRPTGRGDVFPGGHQEIPARLAHWLPADDRERPVSSSRPGDNPRGNSRKVILRHKIGVAGEGSAVCRHGAWFQSFASGLLGLSRSRGREGAIPLDTYLDRWAL